MSQLQFFDHMRSFGYRWKLVGERTRRIHAITAREQWNALALLSDDKARGASRRINYWRKQVQLANTRELAERGD